MSIFAFKKFLRARSELEDATVQTWCLNARAYPLLVWFYLINIFKEIFIGWLAISETGRISSKRNGRHCELLQMTDFSRRFKKKNHITSIHFINYLHLIKFPFCERKVFMINNFKLIHFYTLLNYISSTLYNLMLQK